MYMYSFSAWPKYMYCKFSFFLPRWYSMHIAHAYGIVHLHHQLSSPDTFLEVVLVLQHVSRRTSWWCPEWRTVVHEYPSMITAARQEYRHTINVLYIPTHVNQYRNTHTHTYMYIQTLIPQYIIQCTCTCTYEHWCLNTHTYTRTLTPHVNLSSALLETRSETRYSWNGFQVTVFI